MPDKKVETLCKNCKYFVPTDPERPECRRFPPTLVFDTTVPYNPVTWFPETDGNFWCGEYKEKSK